MLHVCAPHSGGPIRIGVSKTVFMYVVKEGSSQAVETRREDSAKKFARIGTSLPYALSAVMHALILCAYAALKISPHTDPHPRIQCQPPSTESV